MEKYYDIFTKAMLVCFTTGEANNNEFLELRNDVIIDALTYHKCVVPIVQKTLSDARELFLNFADGYDNV